MPIETTPPWLWGDTTCTEEALESARGVVIRHIPEGEERDQVLSMLFDEPKSRSTLTPVQLQAGQKLPGDAKDKIRDLVATGLSDAAIADQLGVSRQAVTGVRTNPPTGRTTPTPTPKETTMPEPTPAPLPAPPKKPLTVDPVTIWDAPEPTSAAQPLAERSQDADPQEDAGDPAIETEAPAERTPAAEAEDMGHPDTTKPAPLRTDKYTTGLNAAQKRARLTEIRDWCRRNGFPGVPTHGRIPQDALAAYDNAYEGRTTTQPETLAEELRPDFQELAESIGDTFELEISVAQVIGEAYSEEVDRKLAEWDQAEANDYTDVLDEARTRANGTESAESGTAVGADATFEPGNETEPVTAGAIAEIFDVPVDVLTETAREDDHDAATDPAIAIMPEVGMRAWLRYDDGVAVVREVTVDPDDHGTLVRVSYLPDPRDQESYSEAAWTAEHHWLDIISDPETADVFTFDHFPEKRDFTPSIAEDLERWERERRYSIVAPDSGQLIPITNEHAQRLLADIPPGPRPEWADVTISHDVERARSLTARIWDDNTKLEEALAEAERQRDAAQASMILALRQWADGKAQLERMRLALEAERFANALLRTSKWATANLRRDVSARSRRRFL